MSEPYIPSGDKWHAVRGLWRRHSAVVNNILQALFDRGLFQPIGSQPMSV
jgi:hypothetical protein